ncbi:MAG TPA: hypothetical protein VF178_01745, partial [Gemmatimonadaceae bacterium]
RRAMRVATITICAAALGLAACGDAPTEDRRGYTKAPLEEPGLTIQSETTTEIGQLGQPQLPEVVEIPPPADTAGAAGAGT